MAEKQHTHPAVFHLVLLLCCASICLSVPLKPVEESLTTERDLDIFDINKNAGLKLPEGDIVDRKSQQRKPRNSIIGDQYKWPKTIPYYFEDNLEVNARSVILKAFDQFRLKTCIDFQPWNGEQNFVSIFKGDGCFSFVGNDGSGRQRMSIGENCDQIGIVEHELFHVLGFYHEHSRTDRDDYIDIIWDRIVHGERKNFNSFDDATSNTLNVPYDYSSITHYRKCTFSETTLPTIVAKRHFFTDLLGQRMEMSERDALKVLLHYECALTVTFMDSCDFELINICGMIQQSNSRRRWSRLSAATGGPDFDHTFNGRCTGSGYFMHFNPGTSQVNETAILESRVFYPKKTLQCLEFYFHNSGNPNDELGIYIREHMVTSDKGVVRHIKTIRGQNQRSWQLHYVNIFTPMKFRVIFNATKVPSTTPSRGMSLDDLNLWGAPCPEFVWRVKNFRDLMTDTPVNVAVTSPIFTSAQGYQFEMRLFPNGLRESPHFLLIYVHLIVYENDTSHQWPCTWKQITVTLLDQNNNVQKRMSPQRSFTTKPGSLVNGTNIWDDPKKVGVQMVDPDGCIYYQGPSVGHKLISHSLFRSRDFIRDNDVIFLITMEDVSYLAQPQRLPKGHARLPLVDGAKRSADYLDCRDIMCENGGVCRMSAGKPVCRCPAGDDWWFYGTYCQHEGSVKDKTNLAITSSMSVLIAMLLVLPMSLIYFRKKQSSPDPRTQVIDKVEDFRLKQATKKESED